MKQELPKGWITETDEEGNIITWNNEFLNKYIYGIDPYENEDNSNSYYFVIMDLKTGKINE